MEATPWTCRAIALAIAASVAAAGEAGIDVLGASPIGSDLDAVMGLAVQRSGVLVAAANVSADAPLKTTSGRGRAAVLRLTPDGRKLISLVRLRGEVRDLAVDGRDNLYLALGDGGAVKLSPDATRELWSRGSACQRIDAGRDGTCALLSGEGITVIDPKGKVLGTAPGREGVQDVCISATNRLVVTCGFRNARASDGNRVEPVQICYVRAVDYAGGARWTDYDWATDGASERFVNASGNNMADTRAYRCAIGADDRLYVAFEAAGGNHIFRYDPRDIRRPFKTTGGDAFHEFYNSASEHKIVFGRFDAATGEALAIQQFCARLSTGKANTVRIEGGAIAADAEGRVVLGGHAAWGLPLSWDAAPPDAYTGGAFVLVMAPDLRRRELCLRLDPGQGQTHAVAAALLDGSSLVAWGGSGASADIFRKDPVQAKPAGVPGVKTGFVATAGPTNLVGQLKTPGGTSAAAPAGASRPRPARHTTEGLRAKADRVLLDALARLAAKAPPRPAPFVLSATRYPVTLISAATNGTLVCEAQTAQGARTATFTFNALTPSDRAALATLVSQSAGDSGSHALAGFYLELAGDTADADRHFRQAGDATAREIAKLFAPTAAAP